MYGSEQSDDSSLWRGDMNSQYDKSITAYTLADMNKISQAAQPISVETKQGRSKVETLLNSNRDTLRESQLLSLRSPASGRVTVTEERIGLRRCGCRDKAEEVEVIGESELRDLGLWQHERE